MKAPDEGPLDFLDDGLLRAFNPFSVPDWMFGGFLIVLILLFLIGGASIQIAQEQARDDEFKDRLKRLGHPADTKTRNPAPFLRTETRMIDWNKYQAEALTTAVYPLERELDYTILGLCSEVAEVAELAIPEDTRGAAEWYKAMKSELGDVLWYAAAVSDAMKTPLEEVAALGTAKVSPMTGSLDATLHLVSAAGNLAGLLKKAIRDDNGHVSDTRSYAMKVELERVLLLVDILCESCGSSINAVAQANLNKLADRKMRGALQGSGDNR